MINFLEKIFSDQTRKTERFLVIAISFLPVLIALIFMPGFMGDDTFIHVGFIKGLLETGKFTFTGNETYGTTSPLWVILNSLFTPVVQNPELSIRILSGLFSISTMLLLNYALKVFEINSTLRILLLISLALNPFFIKWSISGMEASASMTAMLLCLILLIMSDDRYLNILGAVIGLSFLLRPEFLVVFIGSLIFFLIEKRNRKFLFSFILQFAIIITSWFTYAYIHFRTIIPNTFRAKAKDNFFEIESEKLIRNIKVLFAGNLPEFIIVGLLVFISLLTAYKKNSIQDLIKKTSNIISNSKASVGLIWIIGFYGYYILKNVTILSRYSLMFVPIIIILTGIFLHNTKSLIAEKLYHNFLILYFVLILTLNNFITFNTVIPTSNNFAEGFQNTFRQIAQIIKNDSTLKNKTVALTDVGIVGTYSGAKVYDLAGLVDEDRFIYKNYFEYVINKKPDYIVLREEANISEVIPQNTNYDILYQKKVPGFGINSPEPRTVTLYKIFW